MLQAMQQVGQFFHTLNTGLQAMDRFFKWIGHMGIEGLLAVFVMFALFLVPFDGKLHRYIPIALGIYVLFRAFRAL